MVHIKKKKNLQKKKKKRKKESSFLGLETEERVCNGKITMGQKEILGVTDISLR